MKLQKIKDVRVGQIWEYKDFLIEIRPRECFQGIYHNGIQTVNLDIDSSFWDELYKKSKLIGFLGITHKIEDNKLIEMSREEFESDDIIEYQNKIFIIAWVNKEERDYMHIINEQLDRETINLRYSNNYKKVKKLGILGVNYEFINDKLIKE